MGGPVFLEDRTFLGFDAVPKGLGNGCPLASVSGSLVLVVFSAFCGPHAAPLTSCCTNAEAATHVRFAVCR